MPTEALIADLAADARPVARLGSPMRRALATLGVIAAAGSVAMFASDGVALLAGHAGREGWLPLEMAAVLATGLLAVTAAFFAAVPGRSKLWLAAPLPFFAAWLAMNGAGCYAEIVANPGQAWRMGESWHCLLFITGTSAVVAAPLAWRLSRAHPIHPVRVATLAGLGSAALSAFLLHFYHHPFDVTAVCLAVHVGAVLLVTATMIALNRRTLRPA